MIKVLIKVKKRYFEHDSCFHEEEELIGITSNKTPNSLKKGDNHITVDDVTVSVPPYHNGIDIDIVSSFWWEEKND